MTGKNKYRILGIDPGTNILGFSVIEVMNDKITLIELDIIKMSKSLTHYEKLESIFNNLQKIIKSYNPQILSIEAPFFGKNVQSMLKLGRAQGVAIAAGITLGMEIYEYSPKKIKQSITGNGNASKEQVAAMLKNIIIADFNTLQLDATDSLAAAVCHHFQSNNRISSGKKFSGWSDFVKNNPSRIKNKK